jgi:hypothetical protein
VSMTDLYFVSIDLLLEEKEKLSWVLTV